MTTPALQSEHIARAVRTALEADLAEALGAVADAWAAAGAPLALPPIARYGFGFKETVQAMPPDVFPLVSVLAAAVTPVEEGSDQAWTEATHQLLIEVLVHVPATDETDPTPNEQAMILAWRYAEACAAVIRAQSTFAGFELASAVPTTIEGQPLQHRPKSDGGRFTGWLCGRVLQYQLRGEYAS